MVANTAAPDLGEDLPAAWPSQETLAFLARRRSTTARLLAGPGPDAEALSLMLRIAARAPDHRRVTPFRFIVYEGAARTRAGEALAAAFRTMEPGAADDRVAQERARFERAPVVVAVVSKVDPNHKTPEWEQILTAGAVCQNLLLAALASGFAAQWLTEWYA
ncbi:MAG: nitroreductase family protein, partial [Pseudomonadota bacterium]